MSSLATTWSPSSFQLRFASSCRKSVAVYVRLRVGKVDRRVRLFSVAGDDARNGFGRERFRSENFSVISSSSADEFAGWSNADNGDESSDSQQRKQSIAGILGAGVAGVLLVVGLTFAALSLGKRTRAGVQQQMEPLTTKEELSLTSDDQNDRPLLENNENGHETQKNRSQERKTGIAEDLSSNTENAEVNETRLSDDTPVVSESSGDGLSNNTSNQQDIDNDHIVDDILVTPEVTLKPVELGESGNSFAESSFPRSDGSFVAEKPEPTSEPEEQTAAVYSPETKINDPLVFEPNVENINNDVTVTEISDSSLDSLINNPSVVNATINSHLDAAPMPTEVNEIGSETQGSFSTNGVNGSKILEASTKEDESSHRKQSLDKTLSLETASVSAEPFLSASEKPENSHIDVNGSGISLNSSSYGTLFTSSGVPAPSAVSAVLQAPPGNVLVPAVVDQVQGQALAALQALKVIESDVQPGDLCTRREYARWLVLASSVLSRSPVTKVYPAMYIENASELAFDDVTPGDPDFPFIQGLAEAGLISSKLSRRDMQTSSDDNEGPFFFSPQSPLSRQDLVSWKMAVEKIQLPVVDRKTIQQLSGFIDIDKIDPDAWPAVAADIGAGDHGIIALALGYTRLFQPNKPVTKAQAAVALATGEASDVVGEELARIEAESMAEKAVAAHNDLVAQVEKDVNASFEEELLLERKKIDAVKKMAEEAQEELERMRTEQEEENLVLMKERAAIDSEMEGLSRLRREVEEKLQNLMSDKLEVSFEKERLAKLRKDAEFENQEIARLQHELEIERKALSMARAWAEDEAKRARQQAKVLEEARYRWQSKGIKVVVDDDLLEEENAGVTWLGAGKQFAVEETVNRAEDLMDKLKAMAETVRGKSRDTIHKIMEKIKSLISTLEELAIRVGQKARHLQDAAVSKTSSSLQGVKQSSAEFSSAVREGVKRVSDDCREGMEKITQRFKT